MVDQIELMNEINDLIIAMAKFVNKPVVSYSVSFDEISITFGSAACEFGFSGMQATYSFGGYGELKNYVSKLTGNSTNC